MKREPGKKGRPARPHPVTQVGLRIDEETVLKLDRIAEKEGRSRSKQVEMAIRDFIERYEKSEKEK
jgi:predicted transcriptional regulator